MLQRKSSRSLSIGIIIVFILGCRFIPFIVPINTSTPIDQEDIQPGGEIDDFLFRLAMAEEFSGAALIAQGNEILLNKGYGMANLELGVLNTPQTKFRIGAITNQFTALGILQLQEQGKLNVQDPICSHLMNCPPAWQEITIHHLLTHTSGIPDYTEAPDFLEFAKQSVSPIDIMYRFRDLPLDFAPGEKFSYSHSGYILLGYLIETVAKNPYDFTLYKNILEPLHMSDTWLDSHHNVTENRASGYVNSFFNAEYVDMSAYYSSAGFHSTVEDLFRWQQALSNDELISPTLRQEMFTPYVPVPGSALSYGYGWYFGEENNRKTISNRGSVPGFSSVIIQYPEDKIVLILLCNRQDVTINKIVNEVTQMMFAEK